MSECAKCASESIPSRCVYFFFSYNSPLLAHPFTYDTLCRTSFKLILLITTLL